MAGNSEIKFEPYEAINFNQAYFKASIKYKLDASSHTCNVYELFKFKYGKDKSVEEIDLKDIKDDDYNYISLKALRF